jgi:hypothetical protein
MSITMIELKRPTQDEIVEVLREHFLFKLREVVKRAFLVGSFAGGAPPNPPFPA